MAKRPSGEHKGHFECLQCKVCEELTFIVILCIVVQSKQRHEQPIFVTVGEAPLPPQGGSSRLSPLESAALSGS